MAAVSFVGPDQPIRHMGYGYRILHHNALIARRRQIPNPREQVD
jgi:hypothetical protein